MKEHVYLGERFHAVSTEYSLSITFGHPVVKDDWCQVVMPLGTAKQLALVLRRVLLGMEDRTGPIFVDREVLEEMGISPDDWGAWRAMP